MKKTKISLSEALCCFCALALLLTVCECFLPYKEQRIYSGLIRLHVIANSDSERDQSVKLAVRDELIALSQNVLCDCSSLESAEQKIKSAFDKIEYAADSVLGSSGFDYRSKAELTKERYDTRTYDGIMFPQGEYLSLKVVLGDGEGKNWWCVLFPPLCLSAASAEKGLFTIGMDEESQKTFTSSKKRYRLKFKLLEWLFG